MRAKFYTVKSTWRKPGWWNYKLEFHIADRFVAISGTFYYTYWCMFLKWDGR